VVGPTLITGATGLLGSHVLERWCDADGDLALVERSVDDLLEPGAPAALVRRVRPARILHLAWSASGTHGYRHSTENDAWRQATLELVGAAEEVGATMWATGTVVDASSSGSDAYTVAKRELRAELGPRIEAHAMGWLRPFYVFDPDRGRPEVVGATVIALREGRAVELRTPTAAHDFVHAGDVASAALCALRQDLRGPIDVGSGRIRTVGELVAALGATWEGAAAGVGVTHPETAADIDRMLASGWSPTITEEFFAR
jgi:nucleoside-diphosphate-sugar epimerase